MLIFIIQRSMQAIIVMLFVSFVSFGLFQFIGDPVSNLASIHSTVKEREEIREKLGLNKPFYSQYFNYIKNILNGDFGKSYKLLKDDGQLVGIFLPLNKNISEGGPPFSVNIAETINKFSKYYKLLECYKSTNSIKSRVGNEIYVSMEKCIK